MSPSGSRTEPYASGGAPLKLDFVSPKTFATFTVAGKRLIDAGPRGNVEPVEPHNMPGIFNPDAGRIQPEQRHPWRGPTHPAAHVGAGCNFDQQCFHRAFDVAAIRGLPDAERDAALRDCVLLTVHRSHLAVLYCCDYATKQVESQGNAFQSVGVSLADLDQRPKDGSG